MSIYDSRKFQEKQMMVMASYNRNNDGNAYFADTLRNALQIFAEHHGKDKVSMILVAGTPLFRGIVDLASDTFTYQDGDTAHSFLSDLHDHVANRLKKDYEDPIRKALSKLINL